MAPVASVGAERDHAPRVLQPNGSGHPSKGRPKEEGTVNVVGNDGVVLDATFSVEESPLSLLYESAGGRIGVNARNRDYGRGLVLVLNRLGKLSAIVTDIRVDSIVTRRLPPDMRSITLRRHDMPLRMADVDDFDDLKRDILTAAREPGAREGASRGGSSRRLRFTIDAPGWSASAMERALAGHGTVPEADAVHTVVDTAAGRTLAQSQGFLISPTIKRAVELHAMGRAIGYYSREWDVQDVHADHPYDLECRRRAEVKYVEVKGTTTSGKGVILTVNEVEHARVHHPNTELFVVSNIVVQQDGKSDPLASGGIDSRHPG
jgi:hypothetical protein